MDGEGELVGYLEVKLKGSGPNREYIPDKVAPPGAVSIADKYKVAVCKDYSGASQHA